LLTIATEMATQIAQRAAAAIGNPSGMVLMAAGRPLCP